MERLTGSALLLAAAVAAGCSDRGAAEPEPSRLHRGAPPRLALLISLDTVRADRLSCYGYERATAPHLASLAADGILFENAVAQSSQTLVSHKSLLAARYPLALVRDRSGFGLRDLADGPAPRYRAVSALRGADAAPILALAQAGFETIAFTDGGWMGKEFGFHHGFLDFDESGGGLAANVEKLERLLEHPSERPRFVFLHAYDVHCPYTPPEEFTRRFCADCTEHVSLAERCGRGDLEEEELSERDLRAISDHYDAGIAAADAALGRVLDALRAAGEYDEALIAVTSDHGESLGEHGRIGHGEMYVEHLLVPLVMKLPASWARPPARNAGPVELVDVLPTVLDVCGLEPPSELDGRSLLPVLLGEDTRVRHLAAAQVAFRDERTQHFNPAKRAVLAPGEWLVVNDARSGETWAHDLTRDPAGLVDLAEEPPEPVSALLAAMHSLDPPSGMPPGGESELEPVSEPVLESLRQLGYATGDE
jgi:arylsulfatase A-like enzyme